MQRRKLLKTMAATGAVSFGMTSSVTAVRIDARDVDEAKAIRDGAVVEAVENPTEADFDRLKALAGDGDIVMYVEEECSTHCKTDCSTACEGADTCYYREDCSDTQWCC